jgi:hypothetical protein
MLMEQGLLREIESAEPGSSLMFSSDATVYRLVAADERR